MKGHCVHTGRAYFKDLVKLSQGVALVEFLLLADMAKVLAFLLLILKLTASFLCLNFFIILFVSCFFFWQQFWFCN